MPKMPLLELLLCFTSAQGKLDDYLLVFAADGLPYLPTKGHTFAAVVRVEKSADRPPRVVETTSMSWLPATMKVRPLALKSEQGRNVPLHETLDFYVSTGSRISLWGPYRIQTELADKFKARVATVEGDFQYKAASWLSPRHVCDCARAVEELIEPRRRYIGIFGYGAAASSIIVQKFTPWIIEPEQTHPAVESLVGLDHYPISRRTFGDYTSRLDQGSASLRRN